MTLVKCCGMFREEDMAAVNACRPDFCGFVIDFPPSHRSVTPEQARALRSRLDGGIAAVGVFVDQEPGRIADIAESCGLFAVQLHGSEPDSDIAAIKRKADVTVIRAFKVRTPEDLDAARASSADYVLLDNGQGTGKAFDWTLLDGFIRPYFLAGGLTPQTVSGAIARLAPFAVDMSSGIETNGVKDPDKMARAVKAVRDAGRGELPPVPTHGR